MQQKNEGDDCDGNNHDVHHQTEDNSINYQTTLFLDQDANSPREGVNDDSTYPHGPPTVSYDVPRTHVNNNINSNQSPPNDWYSTPQSNVRIDPPPSRAISEVYAVIQKNTKNKLAPCEATPVDRYASPPSNRVSDDIIADGDNAQYAVPKKKVPKRKAPVDEPSPNESPYVTLSNDSNYANLEKTDKVVI